MNVPELAWGVPTPAPLARPSPPGGIDPRSEPLPAGRATRTLLAALATIPLLVGTTYPGFQFLVVPIFALTVVVGVEAARIHRQFPFSHTYTSATGTDDVGFLIPRKAEPTLPPVELLPPQAFTVSAELAATIARLRLAFRSRSITSPQDAHE